MLSTDSLYGILIGYPVIQKNIIKTTIIGHSTSWVDCSHNILLNRMWVFLYRLWMLATVLAFVAAFCCVVSSLVTELMIGPLGAHKKKSKKNPSTFSLSGKLYIVTYCTLLPALSYSFSTLQHCTLDWPIRCVCNVLTMEHQKIRVCLMFSNISYLRLSLCPGSLPIYITHEAGISDSAGFCWSHTSSDFPYHTSNTRCALSSILLLQTREERLISEIHCCWDRFEENKKLHRLGPQVV